jgi:hypothetical protein
MENPPSLPGRWESPLLSVPSGNFSITATHGRGTVPRHVHWVLVNAQPENSYQPGDEIVLGQQANNSHDITPWANAVVVGLVSFSSINVLNKSNPASGFVPSTGWWRLKCYADF